jgi:alpha-ribazole phosphatase
MKHITDAFEKVNWRNMTQQKRITNFWLIRHAPVDLPYIYGQMDVAATFNGQLDFGWIAGQLPEDSQLVSSDLGRCTETARQIAVKSKLQIKTVTNLKLLREQHFGSWQGQSYEDVEKRDPTNYEAFWKSYAHTAPPGGESFADVFDRVGSAIEQLKAQDQINDFVCVCHAGSIRAMLAHALNLDLEKALSFDIRPLSLTKISLFSGEPANSWQVHWINRVCED